MYLKRAGLIAIIGIAFDASIASAECPTFSVTISEPMSVAIFSGVATETINLNFSQIVTFNVDQVWKGTPGKEVTAYQIVSSEQPRLSLGDRYLVFAAPRNLSGAPFKPYPGIGEDTLLQIESDKQRLEKIELGMLGCASGREDAAVSQRMIKELGPGHPPQ
jgi:hypothetical protein